MKFISTLLTAAGILAAAISPGHADTITWTNTVPGNWNFATNWSPQEVPTTNDHVIITSGNVTVPANGTFAILDWSGGTINGSITVITNAVLNLSWNATTSLNGSLTNAGTVNVTGTGQLQLTTGPINNLPGGIIDFKANQSWLGFPVATFYNAGLVRKTAGTGVTQFGQSGFLINFINTGTVEADTGTISFNNGGQIDGNYQAASGAIINFTAGTFTPGVNPVLSGSGAVKFTGTTLTLPTNVITGLQMAGGTVNLGPAFQGGSITNLTVTGSTLATTNLVTGTLTLSGGFFGALTVAGGGTFTWTAGSMTGPLNVLTNGVVNLGWSTTTSMNGSLTNAGTVNVTGAGQFQLTAGPINNLPGGIIDFKANQSWLGFTPCIFYNAGLVRKTAGTANTQLGQSGFPLTFVNTGTVEADSGTITFNSGGQIDGNYQAASGATINFVLGTFTVGSPVLSGAGAIKFTGTSLTLLNNLIPGLQLAGGTLNLGPAFQGGTITNLNLQGMTLAGTNTITGTAVLAGGFTGVLTVASNAVVTQLAGTSSGALLVAGGATVNWTNNSAYTGSMTVLTNGVLNINLNSATALTGSLTNAGTVNVTGTGQFQLTPGPVNNLAGGIMDFKADQSWIGFPSAATFYNAGLVRKTAGTGITQFGQSGFPLAFINTGTVQADTGTITFNSGGQVDGNYQAAPGATINFAVGTFTVGSPVLSGAGAIKFTGTTLTLLNNLVPGLQLAGGTLNLGPAFQGGTITNLNLQGMTLAGTNTITGTAVLAGGFTGVLIVASNAVITQLSGTSSGALTVAGGATVNWTNTSAYTGSLTVLTNGVLNVNFNTATVLTGSLTNAGTVNVTGSGQFQLTTGPINNLAGGIIDFKANQSWLGFTVATFYNAGLVRKTAGTGITQLGQSGFTLTFVNTGTVEADIGTITFESGGQIDGNYQAIGNGTINFAVGTFTAINPVFSGTGTNKFTGTILILANNVVPGLQLLGGTVNVGPAFQGGSITNLVLPGIVLAGTNTITGTAVLAGGFTGALTVASNAVVTQLAGTSSGALIVAGGATVNWTNNSAYTGSITVLTNGVLNINLNSATVLTGSLTNAGTVNVNGTGQFEITTGPINNLAGGMIDFKANQSWLGFPVATLYNAGLVRKTAGTGITQLGQNSFPLTFINTTGTVEADTGTINFNAGGYTDTSAAHIAASLGGSHAVTNYGLITFLNPPQINASLVASTRNGFVPSPGQTFKILSYPSLTNQFNCYSLDLGAGTLLQPQFTATSLTLLVAKYQTSAVLPQAFINPSLGGVAVVWPAAFSGWTLQFKTNLLSPTWTTIPGVWCGNVALVPGAAPAYFRLQN